MSVSLFTAVISLQWGPVVMTGKRTFDGKEPGAAGTKTFTLTNAVYQTSDGGIRVDREGEFSIRGYAEAFAENT